MYTCKHTGVAGYPPRIDGGHSSVEPREKGTSKNVSTTIHGKYNFRSICKECGGSGICPHNRQRRSCKECGGANFCPVCMHTCMPKCIHACMYRYVCMPTYMHAGLHACTHACIQYVHVCVCMQCVHVGTCVRTCICMHVCVRTCICAQHGRFHAQCKECGGTSICPHGRQKAGCKDCGGSSICPVYAHVRMHACMFVGPDVCICVRTCACVHVCVFIACMNVMHTLAAWISMDRYMASCLHACNVHTHA